jgi:glucuronokinase
VTRTVIIRRKAYARAGLIGNPSDGYFGKTISMIVKNYAAEVTLYETPRLAILPQHSDRLEYSGMEDLVADVRLHGYYGGIRLIKAAIKRLNDYCREHGNPLPPRNFTIEYQTNVPVRVGLAGSSAIVTATMKALMDFFEVTVPQPILPNLILSVELEELGIGAGLQDRVIQVYEGAVFMDFDKGHMEREGHGLYEPIDPKLLPPIFIAYHDNLSEGTEVTHNDLRARYNRGDPQVLVGITQWADLALKARDLIVAGRGREIGPILNEGFDLRRKLIHISEGNMRLVETGRKLGAFTQFAGSGGAVVGSYDGDPRQLEMLKVAYEEFGAKLIVPRMA